MIYAFTVNMLHKPILVRNPLNAPPFGASASKIRNMQWKHRKCSFWCIVGNCSIIITTSFSSDTKKVSDT